MSFFGRLRDLLGIGAHEDAAPPTNKDAGPALWSARRQSSVALSGLLSTSRSAADAGRRAGPFC